jgi:hypothetical protein
MSLGSVLELSEDLAPAPRPTLVRRRVDQPREPLIFNAERAALQGRLIQSEGGTFLWFTFPKAHVFVPLAQAYDPSLQSRILQALERGGSIPADIGNIVVEPIDAGDAEPELVGEFAL